MPDREKVIKGLTACRKTICGSCPYNASGEENINPICFIDEMISDALTLLKEQDAKRPNMMQDVEGIWSICPTCGNKLRAILANTMNIYFPKFCAECGQAVKWE